MSGILDNKYHFTFDDSDRRKIIKKRQNIMTKIVWKLFLLSTLPMVIQLSGKSTNFASKMLVTSENN